jgi:hypothetical protein
MIPPRGRRHLHRRRPSPPADAITFAGTVYRRRPPPSPSPGTAYRRRPPSLPLPAETIAAGRRHYLCRQRPLPPAAVTTSAGSEPTPNSLGDNFPAPAGHPLDGSFNNGQRCGDQFRVRLGTVTAQSGCQILAQVSCNWPRCSFFKVGSAEKISDSVLIESHPRSTFSVSGLMANSITLDYRRF